MMLAAYVSASLIHPPAALKAVWYGGARQLGSGPKRAEKEGFRPNRVILQIPRRYV